MYPAFFESRLGDGLQLSFHFIRSMSENSVNTDSKPQDLKGKPEDASFANARLGVSRIYKLIRNNRVARNKFMSSVIRKFDNPTWSETVIPFLVYCTDILALLPFTTPDEPLYLIYTINRVIQVRSGTLEASLKACSSHFAQRNSQRVATGNGRLCQGFLADPFPASAVSIDLNGTVQEPLDGNFSAQSGVDMNVSGSRLLSDDDLQRVQAVCVAATSLQLLLKLKRHLKMVYSLDDVRCQAFSPTEPPKSGEALSRQNIPFGSGNVHNSLPSSPDELTQRYQEFKNALKEDTVDYSTYTANIKRKRPASRRGSKSSRMMGRDDEDYGDDDEEWTGGGRRNANGRQSNGTRASRRL